MGVVIYLNLQNHTFASYNVVQHFLSISHEPVRIQGRFLLSITFLIWTTIGNAAMITISIRAGTKKTSSSYLRKKRSTEHIAFCLYLHYPLLHRLPFDDVLSLTRYYWNIWILTKVMILPTWIHYSFIPRWNLIGSRKRWLTAQFGDRADPRLTVRSILVRAQWTKGQHRAPSWFAHCPVVVRSLAV